MVDEFGARTEQVGAGQTASVEFVADTPGESEHYCSVGQHQARGMRDRFIVE
ncbi:hypothetical protein JXB02_00370 [Candidatus Woesearchaeota archaeon]|nr:hypothetical protein [Candidatus Woesearchaeota archaeon]